MFNQMIIRYLKMFKHIAIYNGFALAVLAM